LPLPAPYKQTKGAPFVAKNIQERSLNTSIGRGDLAPTLRDSLIADYQKVRKFSEQLCETLETEDYVIQSMPDVSPTKWHLAHTSWFFETFLLNSIVPNYTSPHLQYAYLFNSYYNSLGQRHCRPKRGLISRPTVKETYEYRAYVDDYMLNLLETCNEGQLTRIAPILTLGLHHEQQHQELMTTDIKHVLSCNPLHPVYRSGPLSTGRVGAGSAQEAGSVQATGSAQATTPAASPQGPTVPAITWVTFPEGLAWIGHEGDSFCYDNEEPRHREFIHAFQLASRLVTNGEYLQFIEAGGYSDPLLWLSEGWYTLQQEDWEAPLYWEKHAGRWFYMTLSGFREVDMTEPVCHVSYYEADAFARWAGARLPTEAEWELAAKDLPIDGNFVEDGFYHPLPLNIRAESVQGAGSAQGTIPTVLNQMYGDAWEWTQSPYSPYPGYKPAPGAIGEYNGKFMCNQFVLRGGSCATSQTHIRATYRNFFPANARWQFMGLRLAREV
jgi:ergothioneine biosynthesis protein EgtB